MALSKAMLKGMGLTDDQISGIIEGHMESVKALQDEVKAEKERADGLQKDLDTSKNDGWKEKYEKEHSDFEAYKQDVDARNTYKAKELAYKEQLKAAGVSEQLIDLVAKASRNEIDGLEMLEDGSIKDSDKLVESIKKSYADYITESTVNGQKVETPPAGKTDAFDKMTLDDKMAYANEHPDAPEVTTWLNN